MMARRVKNQYAPTLPRGTSALKNHGREVPTAHSCSAMAMQESVPRGPTPASPKAATIPWTSSRVPLVTRRNF